MLFNSYEFIFVFLPITFTIYFYLNKNKLTVAARIWLVFSSLFFYSWWNIAYLPLLLLSVLVNYFVATKIINYQIQNTSYFSKKTLLKVGLIFNVGFLAYFKYMDFFIENINTLFHSSFDLLYLALPLAISFFTLQQIMFLVDSYEGLVKEKKFLNYIVFVTFFPQLILGPILHHKQIIPQLENTRNKLINYKNISAGLFIFSIGMFKKVIIADTVSVWATYGFDTLTDPNFFESWTTSICYTLQLYFDFSGYTDMAIGAALIFNIKIPQNFNSPYRATGIIDFWQRWHITLSNFINSYIYTPFVRSFTKPNFHKAMLATFITFFIVGLWHGASWMFVIFGSLHGLGLVVNQYWKKLKFKLNGFIAWFITFNFLNLTFIFFRARDWDDAVKVLSGMVGMNGIGNFMDLENLGTNGLIEFSFTLIIILISFVILFLSKNSLELLKAYKPTVKTQIIAAFYFAFAIIGLSTVHGFIYFKF